MIYAYEFGQIGNKKLNRENKSKTYHAQGKIKLRNDHEPTNANEPREFLLFQTLALCRLIHVHRKAIGRSVIKIQQLCLVVRYDPHVFHSSLHCHIYEKGLRQVEVVRAVFGQLLLIRVGFPTKLHG